MASRKLLNDTLKILLGSGYVYFQPPESSKLHYPCIMYSLNPGEIRRADNKMYTHINSYTITYIDSNPDNTMADLLLNSFSLINFDRRFVSDNLYHDVFTLYF